MKAVSMVSFLWWMFTKGNERFPEADKAGAVQLQPFNSSASDRSYSCDILKITVPLEMVVPNIVSRVIKRNNLGSHCIQR